MLIRRKRLFIVGIPILIVICIVWWLWISPRLYLIGIVGGAWSDYSEVRHQRGDGENVISFKFTSDNSRTRLVDRLEFREGDGGGNVGAIASSALSACGIEPRYHRRYISGQINNGVLMLFLHNRDAIIVRINY
ncbi:hypothetical protein [Luteolibacter sp. AS25]|uniref:hypothetical protein n=1 Tax=Luteolibacter sp. AS25 TaxID=3135776 RepID=UPI00398BB1C5